MVNIYNTRLFSEPTISDKLLVFLFSLWLIITTLIILIIIVSASDWIAVRLNSVCLTSSNWLQNQQHKVWFILLKNYFPAQAIQHQDSKIPYTLNQAIALMKQSELNHKAKPIRFIHYWFYANFLTCLFPKLLIICGTFTLLMERLIIVPVDSNIEQNNPVYFLLLYRNITVIFTKLIN